MVETPAPESNSSPPSLSAEDQRDLTHFLVAWRQGEQSAVDRVMPYVYKQLRSLAARYMGHERQNHTLSPTALVHEAYLRLAGSDVELRDRAHFLALAAKVMRQILIDWARSLQRVRHGSGAQKLTLTLADSLGGAVEPALAVEVLDLEDALNRLALQDERKSRLMEMIYFGGMVVEEAAMALEISVATAQRDIRLAKAWLKVALSGKERAPDRGPAEPEGDASAQP